MTESEPHAAHYFSRAIDARLAQAAATGDKTGIRRALEDGADIDAIGSEGVTPLLWALARGNGYGVTALLAAGADPDRSDARGRRPVQLACLADDPALLRALVNAGADIERPDPRTGRTPLFTSIEGDTRPQFMMLIAEGAEIDARDHAGCTPLHLAARIRSFACALHLLDAGADPAVVDHEGRRVSDWLIEHDGTSINAEGEVLLHRLRTRIDAPPSGK